eukprot:scaffold126575_cov67-Attheya_sp.AAC.2
MADIANAFLQAPVTEKIWIVCGSEFGPNAGKSATMHTIIIWIVQRSRSIIQKPSCRLYETIGVPGVSGRPRSVVPT